MLIKNLGGPITYIVGSTYSSLLKDLNNSSFFQNRAILALTKIVDILNNYISPFIPGSCTHINIDQSSRLLCNGTCLIITKMGSYVLEAKVISRSNIGYKFYIPRLQGQSLQNVSIYLLQLIFSLE
ncbi:hypothetical protein JHK85_010254 [Glycine max]|uniref:Uncharacterized protein n=1 Tax=Glycine max TaxID=3847 RepID=A0A0R0KEI9_SOYBN|nr:hypothetical protein JHK87_009849 [Glycine soja]KAG5049151.1 hypothetical protein JHK85_010254 [Glycine max]KAG5066247.1 hypothetical protein JHK86_009978 [Glycine max]KAH1111192.1 hypothetical protein GYH30_009815 [Glycine max]